MNPPDANQLATAFGKFAAGYRPGDDLWSELDQEALAHVAPGKTFSPRMRPAPITQIELDIALASGCETPGCDHTDHGHLIFLHTRCHPGDPPWAKYERGGTIMFECSVCRRPLVRVAVAKT